MSDEDLRREVDRLREEVSRLERRLEALEGSDAEGAPADDDESTADEPVACRESTAESAPDGPASEGEPIDAPTDDGRDWELAVGIRLFGLLGALALVVGVVFFVRVAIETGLLGPLGRVAVGTTGGVVLFAVGRYAVIRQGYVRWGRIAAGAGLAVAYFSLYAAYGFEDYRQAIGTPLWAVLLALTVLVAGTAIVSVRDGAPLVVSEAFLLGYVTASLSIDAATLVMTPVYVLLLSAGLVTIATIRPWSKPVVSSTFATYGVLALWIADVDPPAAAIGAVAVAALAIYLLAGAVLRGIDREIDRRYRAELILLTVVNAVAAALFLEVAVRDALSAAGDGLGPIAVAIALAGAYAVFDRRTGRRDDAAAAGSVVLLVGGLQMALEPFATTVVALAVVCGAVALSVSKSLPFPGASEHPGFRVGAHLVAAGLVFKLLAIDATELAAFDASEPVATLTGRPVAFALAIGVFYALAWWFSVSGPERPVSVHGDSVPPASGSYAAAATGLTAIVLALELTGVAISVAWALYGFALLGVGLLVDYRGIRLLGIGILGLTIGKVFLFDTGDLDTAARTVSFVVLGAVLLAASYGYARSRGDLELRLGSRGKE